jgi:hypothetical protein
MASGFVKKLTSVETYDHPLTFVPALALVLIPTVVFLYFVFGKFGVQLPGFSQS